MMEEEPMEQSSAEAADDNIAAAGHDAAGPSATNDQPSAEVVPETSQDEATLAAEVSAYDHQAGGIDDPSLQQGQDELELPGEGASTIGFAHSPGTHRESSNAEASPSDQKCKHKNVPQLSRSGTGSSGGEASEQVLLQGTIAGEQGQEESYPAEPMIPDATSPASRHNKRVMAAEQIPDPPQSLRRPNTPPPHEPVPLEVQALIDSIPAAAAKPRKHPQVGLSLRSTYPLSAQSSSNTVAWGTRSQLGPQPSSEKRSAPSFRFGGTDRFVSPEKVYISREHSRGTLPSWTPGPNEYQLQNTLADKFGHLPTIQRPALGGSEPRFCSETRMQEYYGRIPGPGQYAAMQASLITSTHATSHGAPFTSGRPKVYPVKGFEIQFYGCQSPGPIYAVEAGAGSKPARGAAGFAKALRDIDPSRLNVQEQRSASVPGPGAYAKAEANLDSVRDPAASLGTRFGKAHRDKSLLASLEPDRAYKILQGSCSTAKMYDPDIHAKVVGKYRSPLTTSFTKTARLPAIKSGTPGPGTYVV